MSNPYETPNSQKNYEGILVQHSRKYGTLIINLNSYFPIPLPNQPIGTCHQFNHTTLHDTIRAVRKMSECSATSNV